MSTASQMWGDLYRSRCKWQLPALYLLVLLPAGCGNHPAHTRASAQQDVKVLILDVHESLDAAEWALVMAPLPEEARIRQVIALARQQVTELERCGSSGACEAAGHRLAASLQEGSELFASKRIIPPDPPPDDKKKRRCKPEPMCPHRGGDPVHDECADREPPNIWPGCDALVNGVAFDALTANGGLWEIKTARWSTYSPWLKRIKLGQYKLSALAMYSVAAGCGNRFVFAVADEGLYEVLYDKLKGRVDLRLVPRCQRRPYY